MNKIAMVTGAGSGIGRATAVKLASLGYKIIACGRNTEALGSLKSEIGEANCHLLVFDVRDREAVFGAINSLPAEWKTINLLINNAGNAHGLDTFENGNLDDWDAMIDGNVQGLLYVAKAVVKGMVDRMAGHIINISSIAARQAYAKGAVYCASKAAVDKITEGMRIDLNPYGIKVASVSPGAVETNFSVVRFKGDKETAANVYKGFKPLTAEDVADTIAFMVTAPAHINIADVLLLPTAQASATVIKKDL